RCDSDRLRACLGCGPVRFCRRSPMCGGQIRWIGRRSPVLIRLIMAYKRSPLKTSSGTANTIAARGKKTVSASRLNRRKYAELLSSTLPRIIENDTELQQVTESAEPLLDKGTRRTPEEEALCRLLIRLIEDYQQSQALIPKLEPKEAL